MTLEMPRGANPLRRADLAASEPYRPGAALNAFVPSGEFPSPDYEIAEAPPFKKQSAPRCFLLWPDRVESWISELAVNSFWLEEAFAKACSEPKTHIPSEIIVQMAEKCGSANFSRFMQRHGFRMNGKKYLTGPYYSVNWTDPKTLQSAIYAKGPVKVGIRSHGLESNPFGAVTPGISGWALHGYALDNEEDHCASICGYGNLTDLAGLFESNGAEVIPPVDMPTGMCYAMFVRNSIGIIDEQSMLNMCDEAWIRDPVTIIR